MCTTLNFFSTVNTTYFFFGNPAENLALIEYEVDELGSAWDEELSNMCFNCLEGVFIVKEGSDLVTCPVCSLVLVNSKDFIEVYRNLLFSPWKDSLILSLYLRFILKFFFNINLASFVLVALSAVETFEITRVRPTLKLILQFKRNSSLLFFFLSSSNCVGNFEVGYLNSSKFAAGCSFCGMLEYIEWILN